MLTGHDGRYGGDMLRYAALVNQSPPRSPANSSEDSVLTEKVRFFGDLETRDGQSAWYDCTLSKPASREVRDSYDQFCRPPDIGSRDSIHRSPTGINGRKASYEHLGSKVVPKFGSNASLPEGRSGSLFRNTRFQPILEESPRDRDVPRGNGTLARRQPHHWSTPAVFTKRQDTNNNSDGKASDSDSGDSSRPGRKARRHRPHSLYEGKLRPISEQDSDSKLRCTCDEEEESDDCLKYPVPKRMENGSASSLGKKVPETESSSYLHLDRSESQRLSFTEQLRGWNESPAGNPYDSHPNKDKNPPIDTDSENSVSPAISLVSLSETESDREIARKLYDSKPNETSNSAVAVALPRAVTKLKSNDSESSSDEHGGRGTRDRPRKSSPPVYKEKKPASVTDLNLNPMERADSMDQLKICDPFFQERHRVSRSSSNASSGIGSVQVSSSETNSIESPREPRTRLSYRTSIDRASSGYASSRDSYDNPDRLRPGDFSKRSSVSSDRTSTDRASSDYASSRDSYDNPDRLQPKDFSRAHAQIRLSGRGSRSSDDPYELDPSSSEMDDLETEGTSYNPKVFEEIMALQQEMGVNLDGSDSSRESLKEMEKLSKSELLKYAPNVSPTKYKVDLYSDAEKDQRCSKLMEEYKTNKKLQDCKTKGSQIYRTWDLWWKFDKYYKIQVRFGTSHVPRAFYSRVQCYVHSGYLSTSIFRHRLSTCCLKWANHKGRRPVSVSCHFYRNKSQVQKVMLVGYDWWISSRLVACRKMDVER